MTKVVGRRAASMVMVLLVLAGAVFVLRQVSPVDPARALVGEKAAAPVLARAREALGLNDPLPVQYARYVGNAASGDLGQSAVTRRAVGEDLASYVPATLELVFVAFVLAALLGVAFGIFTASGWPGSGVLRFVMTTTSSLPVFLVAIVGIILFYRRLGWLPATGRSSAVDPPSGPTQLLLVDGILAGRVDVVTNAARHLVMPSLCLAGAPALSIGRVLRSSLQNTLRSDYVRTARAKGMTELRLLVKHGLRNSAGPALAMGGAQIAALFGSVIVVEVIFAWPGVGLYAAQAIAKGDFTTVSGITLTLGVLYVVANTIVDLLQAAADPRLRA